MKVTELHISNFKGIGNIVLTPHERLNVFIGNNGSGKSSLLASLSILLSWVVARVKNNDGKGQLVEQDDIKAGTSGCNLSCRLDVCPDGWNLYRNAEGMPNAGRQKTDLTKLMDYVRELQADMQGDDGYNLPLILHYPATRAVFDVPLRVSKHKFTPLEAYEGALNEAVTDFRRFFEWYREREDLENEQFRNARVRNEDFNTDSQLQAVRTALQAFFPHFTNWHIQRNSLAMMVDKEGTALKINQLSDGEKCFIALIADLARRLAIANPSLDNPLEGKGVVMIDEIDLHLHPSWQMMVIPRLQETFPNCQFFVTTHSPMVINHVRPDSLFMLQQADSEADGKHIFLSEVQLSYGQTVEAVYKALMGVEYTRPTEIALQLENLYRQITENRLDEAKTSVSQLKETLTADPELLKIEGLIRRKELIGK